MDARKLHDSLGVGLEGRLFVFLKADFLYVLSKNKESLRIVTNPLDT